MTSLEALTETAHAEANHTAQIWTFDIERFPMVTYQWGAKNRSGYTGEHMVIEPGRMVSFAAKRQDGMVVFSSEYHHGRKRMLDAIHQIMSTADILVGYNSRRFDVPHVHTELLLDGYTPPPPVKQIDLMQVVKRRFRLEYNNLASVTKALGVETKIDTGGFDLWKRCIAGDKDAWDTMRAYNIQDVHATDALRHRLAPWIPAHPNLGLWIGADRACPTCGSSNVHQAGTAAAATISYVRYQCGDCHAWSRSKHQTARAELRPVAMS